MREGRRKIFDTKKPLEKEMVRIYIALILFNVIIWGILYLIN
jgi:hypothetical protein